MATVSTPSELVVRLRAAGCVFAEDEARLIHNTARTSSELTAMTNRRVAGEPLEHVLGWVEFCGLRIAVAPGVFVPRRRTEFLVTQAVQVSPERPVIVDLCCGSAAVAMALHTRLGEPELHAADVEPASVDCARRNLGDRASVHQGDLCGALPESLWGRIDVLVANTPYVPTGSIALMPPEAREHEPTVALDGGDDGLDVQRRLATTATPWLARGGHLLVEASEQQAPHTAELFARHGLLPRIATSDNLNATVVLGMKPR